MLGKFKICLVVFLLCPNLVFGADGTVSSEDIQSAYELLQEMGWDKSSSSTRQEIFKRIESALGNLDENVKDSEQNYQDMKDKQMSFANRALTSVTTAATGIGGMELATGLAEQRADANADQDMSGYLATFQCSYGGGRNFPFGNAELELPGGNDTSMMKYRSEYIRLVENLKQIKPALGLKAGIESEEILEKSGLYQYENANVANEAFASVYRAKTGSETDKARIDSDKEKSAMRVRGGAIALAGGVAAGIIGNIMINGKSAKNKAAELRSEREQILADLQDALQSAVDECNKNITDLKNHISDCTDVTWDGKTETAAECRQRIQSLTPLRDATEIQKMKDISACKD